MVDSTEATMRVVYDDEFHIVYQQDQSVLRQTVNTRGIVNGKTVQFDTGGVAGRMSQKSRDGTLPYTRPDVNKVQADLVELFKPYSVDDFDLLRNNSSYRNMLMRQGVTSAREEQDYQIIDALSEATTSLSTLDMSNKASVLTMTTALWNNKIPRDGRVWAAITPNAEAQMMRINEFASVDYNVMKPFAEGAKGIGEYRHWAGVNWVVTPLLTGNGTASAECYIYHQDAIGHVDDGEYMFRAGTDEKQGMQHWCWSRIRCCSKIIHQEGIRKFVHDDTAAFS